MLGIVAIGRTIPQVALSPFAGVAADRFDRRQLLLVSQSAMLILAVINAVLVQLGLIEVWHLFAFGFLQGLAFPFIIAPALKNPFFFCLRLPWVRATCSLSILLRCRMMS